MAGEFPVVNPHLLKDLTELGLWDANMKNQLMAANGSVQNIDKVPQELKVRRWAKCPMWVYLDSTPMWGYLDSTMRNRQILSCKANRSQQTLMFRQRQQVPADLDV